MHNVSESSVPSASTSAVENELEGKHVVVLLFWSYPQPPTPPPPLTHILLVLLQALLMGDKANVQNLQRETACLWYYVWAKQMCPRQRREAVDSTGHSQDLVALVLISLSLCVSAQCQPLSCSPHCTDSHHNRDILLNPKSLPLLLCFFVMSPLGITIYTNAEIKNKIIAVCCFLLLLLHFNVHICLI